MRSIRISTMSEGRYRLFCLLLGVLSCGHPAYSASAAQEPSTSANPKATGADQSQQVEALHIAPDDAVITISGLCESPPAEKGAGSNCRTVITRSEFEKLVDAVQPNMKGRARREFALTYASALVMAKKAEQMGLDKGARFDEQMKVARIQILSRELKKTMESEASQISDTDIERYYHDNTSSFEEAEMERIYFPKTQDMATPPDKALSETDKQRQLQQSAEFMKEVADKLHARALNGEDFDKLQAEAYQIAGIKTTASASLGKIRRISLPPSEVWVMDLRPGEVSSVIASPNGYFIYKIKTKRTLTLEQAHEEIKGVLRSRRLQEETEAVEESATTTLNTSYFRRQRPPQGANAPAGRPETQ